MGKISQDGLVHVTNLSSLLAPGPGILSFHAGNYDKSSLTEHPGKGYIRMLLLEKARLAKPLTIVPNKEPLYTSTLDNTILTCYNHLR